MPSAITVIPPDGSNAVKANFRSNFTSAKAESEHGGFFTQRGALASFTGQVERQTEQRLNDLSISVHDYGAVGDETSGRSVSGSPVARGTAAMRIWPRSRSTIRMSSRSATRSTGRRSRRH